MKKAIEILKSYVRSYQSQIDLFNSNPHNQAITEYSSNEAKKHIEELNKAILILESEGEPCVNKKNNECTVNW